MNGSLAAVVLCAGKGTRMKSERAKVLHSILGRPMAFYPLERAFEVRANPVVAVVGHQADEVKAALLPLFPGQPLSFAVQEQQKGTGDAVAAARAALGRFSGAVLILYGDVPLLTTETLERLLAAFRKAKAPLALVSCRPADPSGYGRVVREGGKVTRIVEHKDASPAELSIGEINAGIYVVESTFLWKSLERLEPKNAQGELYLTDLVAMAAKEGDVGSVEASAEETAGVNDRAELAARAVALRTRINAAHMRFGVTLQDPTSTWIDDDVELGFDTIIGPQVTLSNGTRVGAGATIEQGSVVTRSTVGDGAHVKPYSVLDECVVGPRCQIGPFARLRPGTVLDENVHIGNFVETKKTRIGKGSKANHLAYLGDATIGTGSNIGAGTITCNYDGVNKLPTTIGNNVFIGSDTQLVAPVKVADGAFVGAGTTVTKDVPRNALAVSRVSQNNIEGWAEKRRQK